VKISPNSAPRYHSCLHESRAARGAQQRRLHMSRTRLARHHRLTVVGLFGNEDLVAHVLPNRCPRAIGVRATAFGKSATSSSNPSAIRGTERASFASSRGAAASRSRASSVSVACSRAASAGEDLRAPVAIASVRILRDHPARPWARHRDHSGDLLAALRAAHLWHELLELGGSESRLARIQSSEMHQPVEL